eukprot:Gb_11434 [translate_table: standard]
MSPTGAEVLLTSIISQRTLDEVEDNDKSLYSISFVYDLVLVTKYRCCTHLQQAVCHGLSLQPKMEIMAMVMIIGTVTQRPLFLSVCPCRAINYLCKPMRVCRSCIAIEDYPVQNSGDKPLEEVGIDGSSGTDGLGQLNEKQFSFEEFDRFSENQIEGEVVQGHGLDCIGDVKTNVAQFEVEDRVLEQLKGGDNAGSRTVESSDSRIEDRGRVLQGFLLRREDELGVLEQFTGRTEAGSRILDGLKNRTGAESRVVERFKIETAESRVLRGEILDSNAEVVLAEHNLRQFKAETRFLEGCKDKNEAKGGFLEGVENRIDAEGSLLEGLKDKIEAEGSVLKEETFVSRIDGGVQVGRNSLRQIEAKSSMLCEFNYEAKMEFRALNGKKIKGSTYAKSFQQCNPTQFVTEVLERFKNQTEAESKVFHEGDNSRAAVEVRFAEHYSSQAEAEHMILQAFKKKAEAEGRFVENEIVGSRIVGEVMFAQHSPIQFEAEGKVLEGLKSKTESEAGVFQGNTFKMMANPEVLLLHQGTLEQAFSCAMRIPMQIFEGKIELERRVLPRGRTLLEIPETKNKIEGMDFQRGGLKAIGMHVTRSLIQNLDGKFQVEGRVLPTHTSPIEILKDKKIEGKGLQVEALDRNDNQLKKSLRGNINRDTTTKDNISMEKQYGSSRLIKSNLRSGKGGQWETKKSKSHKLYGGCIPSILQALESTEDIDEALEPWEANLGAKERSIILKEQWKWERALQIFKWFQRKKCYEMNVIHYNIMLKILGKAQKWDQLKNFWEEMVRDKVLPTNTTYGTLIDVYGKAGLKDEALMWLECMKSQGLQPDEVTMNTVVHIFKKAGEFEKAEQFFQNWSSGKMHLENSIIIHSTKAEPNQQGKKGFLPTASRMGEKLSLEGQVSKRHCLPNHFLQGVPSSIWLLEDKGMSPCSKNAQVQRPHNSYTYNTLIDTYGKAGRLREAAHVFSQMLKEGIVPNTVTFNTMIHTCGSHGHLEEADALIIKMEELGCLPNTRTYNILIALHAENGNIDIASSYFIKMKEAGLRPDIVSYRTLLYALCIRYMVNEVESVVREMDELGVPVDEFSQSAVIRMYIDLGLLKRAWAWFERFHLGGGMSSECYAANIDAYGERGYWLEAEKAFSCSQQRGTKQSILEFNVMIKAYGIANGHFKALKLFESMESQGILPDKCTYSSIIQMLASAELLDEARHFITKMQEAGFMLACTPFCAVIAAYGRLGRAQEAEEMYNEMVKTGVEPNVVVYGALINAFAEAGNVKEAARYFQVMQDAGFAGNPVVYNSLIKVYSKVGLLKEAQEVFQSMKKVGDGPDVFSSNCMIELYSGAGMVNEAQEIFANLKDKGQANEFSFAMMLSLYKKNGRFNEAIEIAKDMQKSRFLTDVLSFNNVIGLYVVDGRLREATEVFQQMLNLGVVPDESTYKTLGTILKKCGVPKEVVNQLDIARKGGIPHCMHALTASLYSMVGMHDEALEACDKLRDISLEIDVSAYNAVIYAFGSAGRIDEALKMFMSMQSKGLEPDVATYTSMIMSYGKVGLVEGVRRMFYKLKQKGFEPNKSTFKAVINAYKSAGRFDLAALVTQEMQFTQHLQECNHFT